MKGNPVIVGLLGGIASGKSTVAGILRELGAAVVDADRIAHEVLREPGIRDRVLDLLGPEVIGADGGLDRQKIGRRVFRDEGLLRILEGIVHPEIRQRLSREIAAATGVEMVVLDAPLLLEGDLHRLVEVLVLVESPRAARRARATRRDGWTDEEHDRRESRQVSLEEKRRRAAVTIRNDGSLADLKTAVVKLHRELLTGRQREDG